ncbi:hypothetical protein FEM48_Zijuj05G0128400 [Ziziphus jujuba var. spinosa]|uniref:UDP-glycosyltransferase 89B2-like n=1 Tax=Ziziphus jujuba var. spinosa TaxID=714518 RepID=A0A978VEX6_ZIZJJ|nr:hypothetical protein FEM48_Zijuj05G0128400 [Ziziphus jujuba var. spinosa]
MSTPITTVHVLVCPYPSSGHIIPLIDLTRRLLTRGLTVTFVVTPTNLPLLQPLLSSHPPSSLQPLVLSIPETTISTSHRLLSIIRATREHHFPALLDWFRSHPSPPVAIISDFFLGWTHHFAGEIGIKRLIFSPSGAISHCVSFSLWQDLPKIDNPDDVNSPISFPNVPNCPVYPWWQLNSVYRSGKEGDPDWELYRSINQANKASWGAVLNSFADLEGVYLEHLKKEMGHDRVWAVGPLLPPSDDDDDDVGPFDRGGSSSLPSHESHIFDDLTDGCVDCRTGTQRGPLYLVYQLGVGFRVGEESKIIPRPIELSSLLVESLDENRPEWGRAKELSDKALGAVKGGSSDKDLDDLVKRLSEL